MRGVFNGCATGGTSLQMAAQAIRHGEADVAMAIGFDKHPAVRLRPIPPSWDSQPGTADRHVPDHPLLRHQDQPLHVRPWHLDKEPGAHRREEPRKRLDQPARLAAQAVLGREILASEVVNHPLTRYMYCGPDEGAAAVVLCRGDHRQEFTSSPVYVRAAELRTRRHGAFELQSPSLPLDLRAQPHRRRVQGGV